MFAELGFQLIQLTHWKRGARLGDEIYAGELFPTNPINALEASSRRDRREYDRGWFPTNPINALEASIQEEIVLEESIEFPTNPINALEARGTKTHLSQGRFRFPTNPINALEARNDAGSVGYCARRFQLIQLTHWKRDRA